MPDLSLSVERSRACATPYGIYFAHVWSADPTAERHVSAAEYKLGHLTERVTRPQAIHELTDRLNKNITSTGADVGRVLSVAYLRFCFGDFHKGFKPAYSPAAFERVASFALVGPDRPVVALKNVSPRSPYLSDTRLAEPLNDPRTLLRRVISPSVLVLEPPVTERERDDPAIRIEQGVFDWRSELIVGLHSLSPRDSRGEYIERLVAQRDFWPR